ncbi:deoxynucleoside kinase [Brevipalpus obovatus]|uniref:deoxynucleoside kinase n=1 Tax=Brevipalpus obovatus TaxID=246614 RepID=UPI003D9F8B14
MNLSLFRTITIFDVGQQLIGLRNLKLCCHYKLHPTSKCHQSRLFINTSTSLLNHSINATESMEPKGTTIVVEGNIGSGKTTVIELLRQKGKAAFIAEPVKKWTNLNGENLLQKLYEDPKRWSFMFQQYVYLTMAQNHEKARKKEGITIMERSIHSARNVFIENLKNRQLITKPEYEVLDSWYNHLASTPGYTPKSYIYVKSDPELCLQRIKSRNRPEEASIDIDYLKGLHTLHQSWLVPKCKHCSHHKKMHASTIVVNNSGDKDALVAELEKASAKIFGQE